MTKFIVLTKIIMYEYLYTLCGPNSRPITLVNMSKAAFDVPIKIVLLSQDCPDIMKAQ